MIFIYLILNVFIMENKIPEKVYKYRDWRSEERRVGKEC